MLIKIVVSLYSVIIVTQIHCLKFSSLEATYNKGVEAYKGERWTECINKLEESLHLYKLFRSVTVNCRLKCNTQKSYDAKGTVEDLWIYKMFLERQLCLRNCLKVGFDDVHLTSNVSEKVLNNLKHRKPYEYLHICYFQMNALPKAASAAYTFLMTNPKQEQMIKNYKYYIHQPEVDENEVTDLESEDFIVLCKLGKKAYNNHNWGETTAAMEEVLTEYMLYENICRLECEGQVNQRWSADFVNIVADNMAHILVCKQNCQYKVNQLNYDSGPDFIADVLNYLQMSYYHLDRIVDGAKAVTSYLVIYPNDEDMLENKKIYISLLDKNMFIPRTDVAYYIERDNYEKKLLHFINFNDENNNYVYF